MLLADRGYDADWIRELASQKGAWANIPPKRNRKDPICFSPYLYRARNLIERFFNQITSAGTGRIGDKVGAKEVGNAGVVVEPELVVLRLLMDAGSVSLRPQRRHRIMPASRASPCLGAPWWRLVGALLLTIVLIASAFSQLM
jgi:hypothetical protein